MELTHKSLRDQREFETMYKNPKHARAMWSQAVIDRYSKPALPPVAIYDKNGQLTPESAVEQAVWQHLLAEIEAEGSDRLPSEGEMMEACQQYYSRHNAASYVARRDSMGAKPVDETKQQVTVGDPFENFSDEELEAMQAALDKLDEEKALAEPEVKPVPEVNFYGSDS